MVASSDPVAMEAERELTAIAGRTVQSEAAAPAAILHAIAWSIGLIPLRISSGITSSRTNAISMDCVAWPLG